MFEWFDRSFRRLGYPTDNRSDTEKVADDMNKVIPFPELKSVPPMPEVNPAKEKPAVSYYRLGITDNNRVSFQMGYSEITLNSQGVDNLIAQLELFRDQIKEQEE